MNETDNSVIIRVSPELKRWIVAEQRAIEAREGRSVTIREVTDRLAIALDRHSLDAPEMRVELVPQLPTPEDTAA